jgi:hypothetical protein
MREMLAVASHLRVSNRARLACIVTINDATDIAGGGKATPTHGATLPLHCGGDTQRDATQSRQAYLNVPAWPLRM